MPLLFKIFENPKLKEYKAKIFNVYDQEYNRPDVEGDKAWSTKRNLDLVWKDDKA